MKNIKPNTDKPLVIVTWRDAKGMGNNAYNEHDIPHGPTIIHTLGWLLKSDDIGVSLASENCTDGEWRSYTFIPRELIEATKYVTKKPTIKKEPNNGKAINSTEIG